MLLSFPSAALITWPTYKLNSTALRRWTKTQAGEIQSLLRASALSRARDFRRWYYSLPRKATSFG